MEIICTGNALQQIITVNDIIELSFKNEMPLNANKAGMVLWLIKENYDFDIGINEDIVDSFISLVYFENIETTKPFKHGDEYESSE